MKLNKIEDEGKWSEHTTRLNSNFNKISQETESLKSTYRALTQSDVLVVSTLPQQGVANTIYRVVGNGSYSDYMYNSDDLTTPILMATYNNAIDLYPQEGSENLITSGAVYESYANQVYLDDQGEASIPDFNPQSDSVWSHGVQEISAANQKQVRANLGFGDGDIDEVPTAGSDNLVKSGGVTEKYGEYAENSEWVKVITDNDDKVLCGIKTDGSIEWSVGVPTPVKKYIEERASTLLSSKVDKEENKSLIDSEYAEKNSSIDDSEFLQAVVDNNEKVLECYKNDGKVTKVFYTPVEFHNAVSIKQDDFNIDEKSVKYVSPTKPLKNVLGSVFNQREYNIQYEDDVYSIFEKCGVKIIRAVNYPSLSEVSKHSTEVLGMTTSIDYGTSVDIVVAKAEQVAKYFDGVERTVYVDSYNNIYDEPASGRVETTLKCKIDYGNFQNEPDLSYQGNTGEALAFFNRTKAVYNAVKSIRPELKVVIGTFADFGNQLFRDLLTIRDDDGKAFWDYGDIIDFHLYSDNYTSIFTRMNIYRNICKESYSVSEYSHLKDKPLWLSEFGTNVFYDASIDSNRCKLLPKQALAYLSCGIEKVFLYKMVSYNMFVVPNPGCYYGIVSPNFDNCAYAGFTYADSNRTPITPDGLLNKTYIYPNEGQPFVGLQYLSKSEVINKGISFNGNGFTLKKLYIGEVIYDGHLHFNELRVLWSGDVVMDGTNSVEILGSSFNDSDFSKYIIADIDDQTMVDITPTSYFYSDSFYSYKFLASFLSNIEDTPDYNDNGKLAIVKCKKTTGLYDYVIWKTDVSVEQIAITLDVSNNSAFYDVKGTLLNNIPTSITDSPIYITDTEFFNIK